MNKSVMMLYNQDEGCRYHRVLSPARYLKDDLNDVLLHATARVDETNAGYDAYFVHGLAVPETQNRMVQFQADGKTWIWSIDDDYKTIPPWNPCRVSPERMASWRSAKMLADWVLVSTPGLARTFEDVAEKVVCAPNLIDVSLYPTPVPAPWPDRRTFTFLWSGSHTHTEDVRPMEKAIRHCLQKYPQSSSPIPLEFVFFGQAPPQGLLTDFLHRGVHWQSPVDLGMYWAVLCGIRPHVSLAPLADCEFNLSKSNIRVLDGWALSSAVIASPVGEYGVVTDGVDGLVARDEDEWVTCLERVIDDQELRVRIAAEGRRRVLKYFNWREHSCRAPWRNAFAKMLGDRGPPPSLNGRAESRHLEAVGMS